MALPLHGQGLGNEAGEVLDRIMKSDEKHKGSRYLILSEMRSSKAIVDMVFEPEIFNIEVSERHQRCGL